MANGVFMTPTGQVYTAAGIGNANDSTLSAVPEMITALTTLGATTRGAAVAEATGKGASQELRKSNNGNH